MDFRFISLLIMGIIIFSLGFFVYLQNRKSRINISFGAFVISVAVWSFSLMLFYSTNKTIWADFWAKAVYFFGGIIPACFYYFSLVFPETPTKIKRVKIFIIFSPNIILFFLYFFTNLMIAHALLEDHNRGFIYGPLHTLFDIHFISVFFLGFRNLFKKYQITHGPVKAQLKYVVFGTLVGLILAGIANVILPWFTIFQFLWLGPPFTLIWVLALSYAIVKHRFMNIRVIATELLIILILLVLLNEIFLSISLVTILLRISFFLLVAILSVLLVRSVINEVKRREEMERLKNALEVAYAKLKELDQAKTDFLSMASHQLRSPLTVVKLGIGALMDGTFGDVKDKRQMDALTKMLENTERLIELINEYLDVSRIELGKMQYNFKEGDLCALISAIVEEYQPRAQARGLKLGFVPLTPALSHKGRGSVSLAKFDEEKMRHVITNLIDNAIKYTMKGKIEVGCEGQGEGALLRVAVKDTGMGLSEEDMGVVFQKFRRAQGGNLRRRDGEPIEGSGLGLHVAKMFVEAHGGKIWVESEGKGKGSTFIFTIPVAGPKEEVKAVQAAPAVPEITAKA
ncbi:hypothetical protein A3B21_01085 [Candidatus Uhrbacteria bacterium RIFCSPLOWO2_01_FULL_47_24]|uniref:histidine kinase n=1 Tax=Candidatus Uhrbacteria bacterium RIFCSPLOWO2_01_FULL_47_24 TaxID=1802401 RepID=A0A1F7UQH3_9BACT|nr:MAG: hypothetical protein A3D58_02265 [Candidatus Uhrbacteria bacterium RIFCSPHIGHO2_02_FULL_46_47]OGL76660.1 MAG: hypothetical protein A3F52_03780 [Candidatus Uhrbacteria bacterium RIFCSPHIGHO2_12_FULL_47_11]OGL79984.1 MAG: hypothetical protein A3B21_01085 [Candidatus Uhrbacteria bacterium RIFCSPLOWO2_01_FULL_47_24]OGL84365.1 MAG: hypothetical protein A3J03_00560 [Candidatus Uhrbacteria bacterium RIFCSPLOWO2_02_FULL_46_25]